MKLYFLFIKYFQEFLLAVSIVILACLPATLVLAPEWLNQENIVVFYAVAHFSLFLVMIIRPLADILQGVKWLRPLVILRKGAGVLSAAIVVSFMLSKLIVDPSGYFMDMLGSNYWSLENLTLFSHLADISAILLLITSNNLSKRLLGKNWKRIQRLSYVYFYGSASYVYFILGETSVLWYLIIVTIVTMLAWLRNHHYILETTKTEAIA